MKKYLIASALLLCCSIAAFSQSRQERLTSHVYYFAADSLCGRKSGSADAFKAAKYIEREYTAIGLKPFFGDSMIVPFTPDEGRVDADLSFHNVVAKIDGSDPAFAGEYIVIGAHFDHLGIRKGEIYNGADDNASGSAALIEIARSLYERRADLRRSVIISAFDGEEMGLFGSNALSQALVDSLGADKIKMMMSIDMVGWYGKSGVLYVEGTGTIKDGRALVGEIAAREGIKLKIKPFETSVLTATDTKGFAEKGIATLAPNTGLKSPYHKPEDTADLIDYDGLDKVTGYLSDVTYKFASDPSCVPSGKVAPKHRQNAPAVEFGLCASYGNSHIAFREAAFNAKTKSAFSAGAALQFNVKLFGLRIEGLYTKAGSLYPDPALPLKATMFYDQSAVVVPVTFILQGKDPVSRPYCGFGGFYSRTLSSSLGTTADVASPNSFGLQFTFGMRFGHIDMAGVWGYGLGDSLFNFDGAPAAGLNCGQFRLAYMF